MCQRTPSLDPGWPTTGLSSGRLRAKSVSAAASLERRRPPGSMRWRERNSSTIAAWCINCCTRFSPKSRWPSCSSCLICSGSAFLVTATRMMSLALRRDRAAACAMRSQTSLYRVSSVLGGGGDTLVAIPLVLVHAPPARGGHQGPPQVGYQAPSRKWEGGRRNSHPGSIRQPPPTCPAFRVPRSTGGCVPTPPPQNDRLPHRREPIQVGYAAPDFTLKHQNRSDWHLADAVKQGDVVLCFYPLSFTSVCGVEMKCVNEEMARWQAKGATVVGISCDSFAVQKAWAEKEGFKQPLLAD